MFFMQRFQLLTADNCHLCDIAKTLLNNLNVEYTVIDIKTDKSLQTEYALKIPVLLNKDLDTELCWHFDEQDIKIFLNE